MVWLVFGSALAFDVKVLGVEGPGKVGCAVFRTAEGFPSDGKRAVAVAEVEASKAVDGAITCRFPDVQGGTVAVSVRHDVDGNGKLDTNLVGMPKEPFGFSRDAKLRTFGPPRFEDASVDARGTIEVTLRP
ncbi:MAG: DUF2141 domain-containing protein, partial [Myxococcota bacterium]